MNGYLLCRIQHQKPNIKTLFSCQVRSQSKYVSEKVLYLKNSRNCRCSKISLCSIMYSKLSYLP